MLPKQIEMDNIVRQVYESIERESHLQNTLFVLLGDHGLTDQGNHGGDSPGEIASAMVFISPLFKSVVNGLESPLVTSKDYKYYSVINQVDLVPTLAGLLGFSTPARNVGEFIPELLKVFETTNDVTRILLRNANQLMRLFEHGNDQASVDTALCDSNCENCRHEEGRIACLWQKVKRLETVTVGNENLIRFIRDVRYSWMRNLSKQILTANLCAVL